VRPTCVYRHWVAFRSLTAVFGRPEPAVRGPVHALDDVALPRYCLPMALAHSKLTAQGQISVPAEVRRRLGVGPGSVLEWEQEGSAIVIRRAGRYSSEDLHHAIFKSRPRRRSLAELKAGIQRHMRRRHAGR
jgi:antitoxin PrlF